MGNCTSKKSPSTSNKKDNKTKAKPDGKELSENEIKKLLDNTKFSRQEIINLHKNFIKECPSGKLTKKDFVKLFKEMHPASDTKAKTGPKVEKFCEYVYNTIDTKKAGFISFTDFMLGFGVTKFGEFSDKCDFAFKLYDLNKDGKISKDELIKVIQALYDLNGIQAKGKDNTPQKRVEAILKRLNHDKKEKEQSFLTKDQFNEACKNDKIVKEYFIDAIFNQQDDAATVSVSVPVSVPASVPVSVSVPVPVSAQVQLQVQTPTPVPSQPETSATTEQATNSSSTNVNN